MWRQTRGLQFGRWLRNAQTRRENVGCNCWKHVDGCLQEIFWIQMFVSEFILPTVSCGRINFGWKVKMDLTTNDFAGGGAPFSCLFIVIPVRKNGKADYLRWLLVINCMQTFKFQFFWSQQKAIFFVFCLNHTYIMLTTPSGLSLVIRHLKGKITDTSDTQQITWLPVDGILVGNTISVVLPGPYLPIKLLNFRLVYKSNTKRTCEANTLHDNNRKLNDTCLT